MKYLPFLAVALLAGCETTRHSTTQKYTRLSVTEQSGETVAEWVAEGKVRKTDQGYEIRAVERRTGPPAEIATRYPNGRLATVVGPNIILEEIEKPEWLFNLDGDHAGTQEGDAVSQPPPTRRYTR